MIRKNHKEVNNLIKDQTSVNKNGMAKENNRLTVNSSINFRHYNKCRTIKVLLLIKI